MAPYNDRQNGAVWKRGAFGAVVFFVIFFSQVFALYFRFFRWREGALEDNRFFFPSLPARRVNSEAALNLKPKQKDQNKHARADGSQKPAGKTQGACCRGHKSTFKNLRKCSEKKQTHMRKIQLSFSPNRIHEEKAQKIKVVGQKKKKNP